MSEVQYRVGIYHKNETNRKAVISVLNSSFDCEEIEKWEDVNTSTADTIVIMSPEMLYPEISFEWMTEVIERLDANVIMVNSDERKWWVYRLNFTQLRNPSDELMHTCLEAYRMAKCSLEK